MGVEWFLVIPSAKVMLHIGRSIEDRYLEKVVSNIKSLLDSMANQTREYMLAKMGLEDNLSELSVRTIAAIVNFADKILSADPRYFKIAMLITLLKEYDNKVYIIPETSPEYSRLINEGYKILTKKHD